MIFFSLRNPNRQGISKTASEDNKLSRWMLPVPQKHIKLPAEQIEMVVYNVSCGISVS
jgi:hypothetical protein